MSDAKPSDPAPPAQASPPEASDTASPQYEFGEDENRVIDSLAAAIMWVRVPLIVVAFLQAVIATGLTLRLSRDGAHIVGILGHALAAIVSFLLAAWLRRAAESFTRITTTKGRDITHLMAALRGLGAWFDMLAFFVKLYLALLGVVIVVLVIGLLSGAFKEPPREETHPPQEVTVSAPAAPPGDAPA